MIQKVLGIIRGNGARAKALRGTMATTMQSLGGQVLRFGSNLVLTRLLFPEAFGLMAIVTAILVGFSAFSTFGLRASVIQNPRGDDEDFLNTAWTLQILRGGVLWLIICAVAPLIAQLYDQPILLQILPVAGLNLLISGFEPSKVLSVQRKLQLGRYSVLQLIAQVIGLISMSLLAWQMHSVWALVIGTLVQSVAALVLYTRYLSGIRNRLLLERDSTKEILNFGKYLFLSTISTYVIKQSDRAVLGLFIPLSLLGVYSIGFGLATLPFMLSQKIADSVLFPLYRMRHPLDAPGNRRNILRARRLVASVALSMLAVLSFVGPWLVELLYDDRYLLAGPVTVLLCLAYVPLVVLNGVMQAALAKGDSLRMMVMNVTTALCQAGSLYFGVQALGVIGAPLAIGISTLLTYPLLAYFLRRYNNWDPLGDALLIGCGALVMGLSVWLHYDDILLLLP